MSLRYRMTKDCFWSRDYLLYISDDSAWILIRLDCIFLMIANTYQVRYMYHIIPIDIRGYLSRLIYVSYNPDRLSQIVIKFDICII